MRELRVTRVRKRLVRRDRASISGILQSIEDQVRYLKNEFTAFLHDDRYKAVKWTILPLACIGFIALLLSSFLPFLLILPLPILFWSSWKAQRRR